MPGSNDFAPFPPSSSDGAAGPIRFSPRRCSRQSPRRVSLGCLLLLALLGGCLAPTGASAAAATKVVRYHGYRLVVPASWPVYHLSAGRSTCVRFDRHAVYVGEPSGAQSCPPSAVGRTEAILVQPLRSQSSGANRATGQVLPLESAAGAAPGQGSSARLIDSAHGVVVTATWRYHPALIRQALGVRSFAAAGATLSQRPGPGAASAAARVVHSYIARMARSSASASGARFSAAASSSVRADAASASVVPAAVYTGLGFDACSTPSSAQMSAWSASPYRAIGVYIGGTNMACSQANLTATWVGQEIAVGWHLIPIYVGLQAPSNSCGCAAISSASAASQGAAAAVDAVAHAQAIGLGPGSPIYFDMEGYSRTTSISSAVLAFLGAWTSQLHTSGYESGVYSSDDSGIVDLVAQVGTGYVEPDDIWIANWNNSETSSDPNVPAADWSAHQRLHQYDGGHNETYGGATINIDGDYLDGATVGAVSAAPAIVSTPALSVSPAADGAVSLRPSWSGGPGVSSWQIMAGSTPTSLGPAANPVSANGKAVVLHSQFAYFAVSALGSNGSTLGSSLPVATPAHMLIFGKSSFVSRQGIGGVPVACSGVPQCLVTTTISAGTRTLARTGSERIASGGGLAYFHLSTGARATLARASRHRLLVRITVRASSGPSATRPVTLIQFATSGSDPQRSVRQSTLLRIVGMTDFVSGGRFGGILVDCQAGTSCHSSTTIVAAGKVIARTRPETLGVNELGYLFFSLTSAGRRLLTDTRGNQLAAKLTVSTGTSTATAHIVLASYS